MRENSILEIMSPRIENHWKEKNHLLSLSFIGVSLMTEYQNIQRERRMVQFLINIKGTIVMLKNSSDVKLVYKDDERVQHIHENLLSAMA